MANNYPNINPSSFDDLYSGFTQIIRSYLNDYLFTAIPVSVASVSEDNRFVNLSPVLQNITTRGQIIPINENDIYYNIPMMTMFGNGCEISFNVAVGDRGLLIGCKYDTSNYKQTHEVSPVGSSRTFSFSDGFFLPLDFKTKTEGVVIRNGETVLNLMPEAVTITTKNATVNAESVNLGGTGGANIARVGDSVQVEITSGSSAGTWNGTITSGSSVSKSI